MFGKAKVITMILIVLALLGGVWLLYLGVRDTIEINWKTKGYVTAEGYLTDYRLYSKGEYDSVKHEQTSDTYRLVYGYMADGQEYEIATNYGTSFLPAIGSKQEIKYNPQNPAEAVIVGKSENTGLIFGGLFFLIIPLIFLAAMQGWLSKLSGRGADLLFGLVLFAIGWGALYMITGSAWISGIWSYFSTSFTPMLLIPVLLAVVGVFLLVRSILSTVAKKKNE